jgi:hypothetical protein
MLAAKNISQPEVSALLIESVQRLSAARSLPEIIAVTKHAARQGTQADGVTFIMVDGDHCHYIDEDAIGPLWKDRRFPMECCVSGWAIKHRTSVVIPDIEHDERIPLQLYRPTFVRSLSIVPIRSREPFGAIGVYWARPHHPAPATVAWLQALADATCAGIETVRALQEVETLRKNSNPPMPAANQPVRMCAWTRRLWHGGQWLSVEAFLTERFGLEITHAMSEEAQRKYLGDLPENSPQNSRASFPG